MDKTKTALKEMKEMSHLKETEANKQKPIYQVLLCNRSIKCTGSCKIKKIEEQLLNSS